MATTRITPKDKRTVLRNVAMGKSYDEARKGTAISTKSAVSKIVHANKETLDQMKLTIQERMEHRERLKDERLLDDLEEGLDAYSTYKGETQPDFGTKFRWWEKAMEMKGHINQHKGPQDLQEVAEKPAVNITILNANVQSSTIRTETPSGSGPNISIGE